MKHYLLRAFITLFVLALATPSWSQNCRLVADLRTDVSNRRELDYIGPIHIAGDHVVFLGAECNQSPELYSIPRGGEKISMVRNLYGDIPGSYCGIDPFWAYYSLTILATSPDAAYFSFPGEVFGYELWATDGTFEHTRLVKDICPGPCASNIHDMVYFDSIMLFVAKDSLNGDGLWRTDGTTDGTFIIKRFNLNQALWGLKSLKVINDSTVCFIVNDPSDTYSIWKTDGSEGGTSQIYSFPADITPIRIVNTSQGLYIPTYDKIIKNYPLWFSNATSSGTHWLHTFATHQIGPFVTLAGKVLFSGCTLTTGCELWQSDGTSAGTFLFKDIEPGSGSSSPQSLIEFNGKVIFFAKNPASQMVIWETDGTPGGTIIFANINPSSSLSPVVHNGNFFFLGTENLGSEVYQFWKYDGDQNEMTALGGSIMLIQSIANNKELIAVRGSDSNSEPTVWQLDLLSEVVTKSTPPYSNNGSSQSNANRAQFNNKLFFFADNGDGVQIWKTDQASPGAEVVTHFQYTNGSPSPNYLTNAGDRILFSNYSTATGGEIWQSKGDWATTTLLADLTPGSVNSVTIPISPPVSDGIFIKSYSNNIRTLWKYNLQTETAVLQGQLGGIQHQFVFGDHLFLNATPPSSDENELWHSAGTPATTGQFLDINPGPVESYPYGFVLGDSAHFFFSADDGQHGYELWRSDGTPNGTAMVADINQNEGSKPVGMRWVQNQLLFLANDEQFGPGLWKSDGTAAGTELVKSIPLLSGSNYYSTYTAVLGNLMVFSFPDSQHGNELWVSDGTFAGTHLIADINPGPFSSTPTELVANDTLVFFSAYTQDSGRELWQTDGTPDGTKLTQDINPGPASSSPTGFGTYFGRLYFNAFAPEIGRELWAYAPDWATVPTLSPPSIENNCLVYPNPLSSNAGILKVDCGQQSLNAACMYDATGRLLQTWQLEGKSAPFELPLSSKALIPGVYFLHLKGQDTAKSGWERVILK